MLSKQLIAKTKDADPEWFEQYVECCIVQRIRQRYNINRELAIHRKRDIQPDEFREYYEYVEACKYEVKSELGLL